MNVWRMSLLVCVIPGLAIAQPKYRATNLGPSTISSMYSYANDGTLGGYVAGGVGMWRNGEVRTVASVIGRPVPTDAFSAPRVRSWNTFSGTSYGAGFGYAVHNGNITIVEPDNQWAAAVDWINDKGDFVGTKYRQSGLQGDPALYSYPFAVLGGTYRRLLNTSDTETWSARAINNKGEIAGTRSNFTALSPYGSGYRWKEANNSAEHLSTFGGSTSLIPRKYLDNGTIFGESTSAQGNCLYWKPDGSHMFIMTAGGSPIEVGDMNQSEMVVGKLEGFYGKGIVWQAGKSWPLKDITLNPDALITGDRVSWRNAVINDLGQIMVNLDYTDGNVQRSNLYRFDPVPEPATFVALGVGVLALRRRQRRSAGCKHS